LLKQQLFQIDQRRISHKKRCEKIGKKYTILGISVTFQKRRRTAELARTGQTSGDKLRAENADWMSPPKPKIANILLLVDPEHVCCFEAVEYVCIHKLSV